MPLDTEPRYGKIRGMEPTTAPTYTPVYDNGRRKEIRGMAASSINDKFYQVSFCETCRTYVAWAQNKAGKWYVCETASYSTESGNERFRAVPYSFHSCAKHVEISLERTDEQVQAQADVNEFMDALRRQAVGTSTSEDELVIAEFNARSVK